MSDPAFSGRLQAAMKSKGYKQVDLLKLADIEGVKLGKSQVSQYVSGDAVPRRNIGEFIAMTFGVDADWLYGENGVEPLLHRNQRPFSRVIGRKI